MSKKKRRLRPQKGRRVIETTTLSPVEGGARLERRVPLPGGGAFRASGMVPAQALPGLVPAGTTVREVEEVQSLSLPGTGAFCFRVPLRGARAFGTWANEIGLSFAPSTDGVSEGRIGLWRFASREKDGSRTANQDDFLWLTTSGRTSAVRRYEAKLSAAEGAEWIELLCLRSLDKGAWKALIQDACARASWHLEFREPVSEAGSNSNSHIRPRRPAPGAVVTERKHWPSSLTEDFTDLQRKPHLRHADLDRAARKARLTQIGNYDRSDPLAYSVNGAIPSYMEAIASGLGAAVIASRATEVIRAGGKIQAGPLMAALGIETWEGAPSAFLRAYLRDALGARPDVVGRSLTDENLLCAILDKACAERERRSREIVQALQSRMMRERQRERLPFLRWCLSLGLVRLEAPPVLCGAPPR